MSDKKIKKIEDPLEEEKGLYLKKIKDITRHIKNVQENALILAERLIEVGELELARKLVQRSFRHDNSKFSGIEWSYLNDKSSELFTEAVIHHQLTNDHHPEFFGGEDGIHKMRDEDLAELIVDWASRSQEMGTNLREYVKTVASLRYGFNIKSRLYRRLKFFMDLLLIKF